MKMPKQSAPIIRTAHNAPANAPAGKVNASGWLDTLKTVGMGALQGGLGAL